MNNFYLKTLTKSFFYCQIRFYRGKYLTSYQKKLSNNSKNINILNVSNEPMDFVVGLSVKNEQKIHEKIKVNNVELTENKKLIEVCDLFRNSDYEYQKLIFYGTENKEIDRTDFHCNSCGSNINCVSTCSPGYVPFEIYSHNCENKEFMKNIQCIRCFYLSNDLDPLDISLNDDFYHDILHKKLKSEISATIILLVDMTDLPWSIPHSLSDLCLPNIRLIVLGNKIDLLPQKSSLKIVYKEHLLNALEQRGIPQEKVQFTELISAIDCTGIDSLIDRIISKKYYKNEPIYLIGSTNVGKSTIFNRLLKSDLCKRVAKRNVQEALVSNLPGTTLNVLRFPMVNSSNALLSRRDNAKVALSKGDIDSAVEAKDTLLDSSQIINKKNSPQSFVQLATYIYCNGEIKPNLFDEHKMKLIYDEGYNYNEDIVKTKKWCYDTPGYINPDQLINYLPKDQLDYLEDSKDMGTPRIYVLKAGLSILMENLARVDILEAISHVYLCVHGVLPVEIVDTHDVALYLTENEHIKKFSFKRNLSKSLLQKIHSTVPSYDSLSHLLPNLISSDMEFHTNGYNETSGDVVLSSIGWVGVSGSVGGLCKVRAWTPASIGCYKRSTSLIPSSVKRRSHRKSHSREFSIT